MIEVGSVSTKELWISGSISVESNGVKSDASDHSYVAQKHMTACQH